MRIDGAHKLLDRTFFIGLILKGLDGVVELVGGIALLLITPAQISALVRALTRHELSEDPHDLIANWLIDYTSSLGVSATVGVLLVLVAPLAVSLGLAGTIVSILACVVVMLRTRQYRTGAEVLVGLASGVLGLVSTAVSVLWLHPGWRPTAAVALAVTGAVLLALTLLPQPGSVRRGRLGDVVETVALLATVPALVIATGLYSSIAG